MLDQNFSIRCALVWAAWIGAAGGIALDWTLRLDPAGRLGVILTAVACTLMVFNDNAKTRRAIRGVLREAERPHADLTSLH